MFFIILSVHFEYVVMLTFDSRARGRARVDFFRRRRITIARERLLHMDPVRLESFSLPCLIRFLQRGAWHPYFMDVKAIIFLAPISVFDERLEGDSGTNRLEDSMKFWTSICTSKLLAKVCTYSLFFFVFAPVISCL